jgi:hypothetical protein
VTDRRFVFAEFMYGRDDSIRWYLKSAGKGAAYMAGKQLYASGKRMKLTTDYGMQTLLRL